MIDEPIEEKKTGTVKVLIHSFFVIPFVITVFGVLFFFMFRILVNESDSARDYLTEVKIGSATKRWQSAFELAKLLSDPDLIPRSEDFRTEMIKAYQYAIHDNPMVRTYLALAMGRTGDNNYGQALIEGLRDEDLNSRLASINALGMIQFQPAITLLKQYLSGSTAQEEKLAAVIALGMIGDKSVITDLQILLSDEEPNLRWDAAVALAKLGDKSGSQVIDNLLDRKYLDNYPSVDEWEKTQAILVAIHISNQISDDRFIPNLKYLASNDMNMKIRDSAIKTLKNTYNLEL